jgi:hypothetical protein
VPLEVTVIDLDTAVPTATLPKTREVPLSVNAGAPLTVGERVMLNVFVIPPDCALMTAV